MLSIRKKDVPEYLCTSPLFQNAFQDDESDAELSIEIPNDCFKSTPDVETESDLRDLLQTIRFWLIPEYIENKVDVFQFAMGDAEALPRLLPEFGRDFPFLAKLSGTVRPSFEYSMMGNAVKFGLLYFVKFLRSKGYSWDVGNPHENFTVVAAKHGKCDCLRYALSNGFSLLRAEDTLAAKGGHVECLKLTHEHGCIPRPELLFVVIEHGHLSCVKYLVEVLASSNVAANTKFCDTAAKFGQLEALKYLHGINFASGISTASCAVVHDHIECLQFLHETGCPLATETLHAAVRCGSLDCVTYLHTQGCPWDVNSLQPTPSHAIINAHSGLLMTYPVISDTDKLIRCFIYAADHGCPVTPGTFMLAISHNSTEFLKYLCDRAAPWNLLVPMGAALDGKLKCLQLLLERGCPCDARAYVNAVWGPHLDIVKCLRTHGVKWDDTVTRAAVAADTLDILQYLLEHDCPVSPDLCTTAAADNRLNCLQMLHEHEAPWTETVLVAACRHGHLGCFKYALEHGCPYTSQTCTFVTSKGITEYLRCLHNHGASLTQEILITAVKHKHLSCLQFALSHGPVECDASVCATAAALPFSHYLECLHEHKIVWDVSTCLAAIRANSLVCLRYAVEHGCPMDASLPTEATLHGRHIMLAYLYEHGCPAASATTVAPALQCFSAL